MGGIPPFGAAFGRMERIWKAYGTRMYDFRRILPFSERLGTTLDSVPEGDVTKEKDDRNNGRNIAEEIAYVKLDIELDDMMTYTRQLLRRAEMIPPEWHSVEKNVPVRPRKTKVTAAYDTEVVKFFRAMGLGYQARMNQVLRAYMLATKSKVIYRLENRDWKGDPIRP